MPTPRTIIRQMKPWRKFGSANNTQDRTLEQQAWDSAVLTCAEFMRRLHNYDEDQARLLLGLMTPCADDGEHDYRMAIPIED